MAKTNTDEATDKIVAENADSAITGSDPGVADITGATTEGIEPEPVELTGVRILTDCNLFGVAYKSGQAAEIDSQLVSDLVANGIVDDHPDAVAFALSQQ